MKLLDLIFPKYCVNCKKYGDFLCTDCFSRLSSDTKNICLVCGFPSYDSLTHPGCKRKFAVEGAFTGIVYNGISKKLIFQFKYKPHLKGLSPFLGDLLFESLIQNEEFNKVIAEKVILVPIPLNNSKMRKRGYNQSEILANELGKKLDFKVANLLERVKDTKPLFGLSKKERVESIKGVFNINSKFKNHKSLIINQNVILVDDILTTGATISEACKVLKKNGAGKVWGLALAREQ